MIILADWTAPVSAIASAVAAVAALVAIVFARQAARAGRKANEYAEGAAVAGRDANKLMSQAAEASRDALREQRRMRVERDFREFARAVQELQHYADEARREQTDEAMSALRRAQTNVRATLVMPTRIVVRQEVVARVSQALDHHETPATVYSATAQLVEDLRDAWNDWLDEDRMDVRREDPPRAT